MADSTIASDKFYLVEGRFGAADQKLGVPKDGFVGSEHHNVSPAAYPVRTVIRVYCDGTAQDATNGEAGGEAGYAEFTYLLAQNADTAIAAKTCCVMESTGDWSSVTNDAGGCVISTGEAPMGCIGIGTMTDQYYGWFWTGGVAPLGYVSALSGNYETKNDVTVGAMVISGGLSASCMGFALIDADDDAVVGYASELDAS